MLPGKGPEHELGHGHVCRCFDPVPRHIAERHCETSVAELHEVVDIAADLDARRRFIGVAQLEAL
jgi:hypothetical protein